MENEKQQPTAASAELKKQLTRLFETYQRPASPEAMAGYREALIHLSYEEILVAFPAAMRRSKQGFIPSPGEILLALELEKDAAPSSTREAWEGCPNCQGTGYRLIPFPYRSPSDYPYKSAIPCECRNESHSDVTRKRTFRASECPEGRAFLALLKEFSIKTL